MCKPVYDLAFSLPCNHIQQRLPQMVSNAAVSHYLVPEYDEAKVVYILHVILLNVHPVLKNKNEEWQCLKIIKMTHPKKP